jgi:hypothetical protein
MPINNYFDVVFAEEGVLTPVPDAVQSSGAISYTQGWTPPYSYAPTQMGYRPVDEGSMNQLFNDITTALQQYQQNGIPPFITSAMNNGSPFSYAQYATVLYNGVAYQSNVSGNTDTPPSTKWNVITLSAPNQFVGGTSTGSANTQVLASVSPANGLSLSVNGQSLTFTAGYTNTGSTTLAITAPAITATVIKKLSGSSLVNLSGGEMVADAPVYLTVDTAANCWVLSSGPALGTIAPLNIGQNIVNNGSGVAVTSIPTTSINGTNETATLAQWGYLVQRSNSGTVAADTLNGTALASGWWATWANEDASALMTIAAGSGAELDGVAEGFAYISPGHKITFVSDGTNYWSTTQQGRLRLKASVTIYVNESTGNDSYPGLTSALPFASLQAAINFVANKVDLNGYNVTISVADGTYTTGVSVNGPWIGTGTVLLQGDTTTPANCIISTTSANCVTVTNNGLLSITGFTLETTTSGSCIASFGGAQVQMNGAIVFGTSSGVDYAHLATSADGVIYVNDNYTITGGAYAHIFENNNGKVTYTPGISVTVSGTPAFTAFTNIQNLSLLNCASVTFSGSATGARYDIGTNSVIDTAGGGASYFPGSSSGSTSSGGQYV